jgi:hypothetical protein
MRRTKTIALAFCLAAIAEPALAQVPRGDRGVAGQLRWVEFRIASGRMLATSQRVRGRGMQTRSTQEGRQESLSVKLTPQGPQINYELITDTEHTTVDFMPPAEVRIRRAPRDAADVVPLEFTQQTGRTLLLAVGDGDARREVRGPTLWHLLLADPALVAELTPLVQVLWPAWRLDAAAAALEQALRTATSDRKSESLDRWRALVAELADDSYAVRRAAYRQLQDAGPALLPFLRSLDRRGLDAEQRWRLQRLRTALEATGSQTDLVTAAEADAAWLAWDVRAWLALLDRDDETLRRLAVEHLESLTEGPIDFDPAAEPQVRAAQAALLRERLIPASSELPLPDGTAAPSEDAAAPNGE